MSRASLYALQALTHLAGHEGEEPVPSHVVAGARGIPERFLLKVLKPLVTARVVSSLKGPRGGYRLARAAGKISVLDVVEAVDGPIQGAAPLAQDLGREGSAFDARLQAVCDQAAEAARKALRKVTVADLAGVG